MKEIMLIEHKHGVGLHIEDSANMTRTTINFSWKEFSGLMWKADEVRKNPSFKEREPKPKPVEEATRKVVHRIEIEDDLV